MRTLPLTLLLLACAPDGSFDPAAPGQSQKKDVDEVPSERGAEVSLSLDCIDTECTVLWVSTDPPAAGTWFLDGAEAGYGKGIKVLVEPGSYAEVDVELDTGDPIDGELSMLDNASVIQSASSCDRFRVVTVGGCIANLTPRVRFDAPALGAPMVFSTLPTGVVGGFGYVAWYPNDARTAQLFWDHPDSNVPVPSGVTIPSGTSTRGFEFWHTVPPGVYAEMSVSHDQGDDPPHPLSAVACFDGTPSLQPAPPGGQ
jgi:hypothetical protein